MALLRGISSPIRVDNKSVTMKVSRPSRHRRSILNMIKVYKILVVFIFTLLTLSFYYYYLHGEDHMVTALYIIIFILSLLNLIIYTFIDEIAEISYKAFKYICKYLDN